MRRVLVLVGFAFAAATAGAAAASVAADRLPSDTLRYYEHAKAQAVKHGWSCIAVKGDRADNGFAYTMGLSSKHLPELAVFATDDTANACAAIDRVAKALVAAHRYPRDGAEIFRNGEGRVVLRGIFPNEFFDRCIFAKIWRDEHHIASARGMQLIVLDPGEAMPR